MQDYYVARVTSKEYDRLWKDWVENYPLQDFGTLTAKMTDIRNADCDIEVYVSAWSEREAQPLIDFLKTSLDVKIPTHVEE